MRIKEYKNKDEVYSVPGGEFLSGFKKLNIFVGANNSGKSRFMRQLYSASADDFVYFDEPIKKLGEIYSNLTPQYQDLYYMQTLKDLSMTRTGDYCSRFNYFVQTLETKMGRNNGTGNIWDLDVAEAIKRQMVEHGILKKFKNTFDPNTRHVYIPILRGLRHLVPGSEGIDLYVNKSVTDYGLAQDEKLKNIFSGLTLYSESKRMLLGSKEGREFMKQFETFISECFFAKKVVTLIPDHDTHNVKLNIDDRKRDREIFNLGDGIQSILIATFKVYQHQKENVVLFIEEPEMMMHPAMQRILIETLIKRFDNLQVFLTTHSNHFLDLMYDYPDDVAIYSFEEVEKEKFKISNIGANAKILDLLGIRNSSVFLANSVIWTEGVTDRMLLRKLLSLDPTFNYTEDSHYTFAEYGGGNLENFDFNEQQISNGVNVSALAKVNYVIADNDNQKKGKRFDRRQNLKEILGEDHVFDEHIEIENLIPYKVWVLAIENLLKKSPDMAFKLKTTRPSMETKFNESLKTKKIGAVLRTIIELKGDSEPRYFSSQDVQCLGKSKKAIMEQVVAAIESLGIQLTEFPESMQTLVASLNKFVTAANS